MSDTEQAMPTSDIQKVLNQLPLLSLDGLGLIQNTDELSSAEFKEALAQSQRRLLANTADFDKACAWFAQIEKSTSMNHKHTSYGLKRLAERDIGAVSHGALIAAAIHCGFKFKTRNGSPNIKFNLAEASLQALVGPKVDVPAETDVKLAE